MPNPTPPNLPHLRTLLDQHFNEGELRDLCFDMGLDYDNLPGHGKGDQARELVAWCARHGTLDDLVARLRVLRPHVAWGAGVGAARVGRARVERAGHRVLRAPRR